jgi:hypothetical protein
VSLATLLNIPNDPAGRNAFEFEHAMAHRTPMQIMGPLGQWSTMPYFIDPFVYDAAPGTTWHHGHQQAHNDFTSFLPANFLTPSEQEGFGIPSNQILLDSRLPVEDSRAWWTFANFQEHYVVSNLTPLPLTVATYPWWLEAPRLVANFW